MREEQVDQEWELDRIVIFKFSKRCFTLGDFLRGMDKNAREDMTQQFPLYKKILTIGAGCFVETEHRRKVKLLKNTLS